MLIISYPVCLSSGVGRAGVFCLLYAALQELEAGNGIPDLPLLVKKMRQQRKNMLQEKVRHICLHFEDVDFITQI